MRLDKLTIKAQEALAAAQGIAEENGSQIVEPLHLLKALLDQAEGIVRPILGKVGADVSRTRLADRRRGEATAAGERRRTRPDRGRPRAQHGAERLVQGRREDEGRLRLHRALPGGARRRQGRGGQAARARRRDPQARGGGARVAARRPEDHRPEPRGAVPGARAVRPQPHRGGARGQARSGHRPRRRDPPCGPGAVSADQEQPRTHRRAGHGQDGDRRGPRPAHRVR